MVTGRAVTSRGRPPDTRRPLLGPDTVAARLLGHPALLLGGPRALLLQVAHPGVAAGVVQHSGFEQDPFGRLARTLTAMEAVAFGSPRRADRALRTIGARHRRVSGRRPDGGTYSAADPELLLWVHATLVDTALVVDQRYIGLLDPAEREVFYDQSRSLARVFGVPEALVPGDLAAFRSYLAATILDLEVAEDARAIAAAVMRPTLGPRWGRMGDVLGAAVAPWLQAVTADLLPPELRRAYGLRRGAGCPAATVALDLAAGVSRTVSPRLPRGLQGPGSLGRLSGAVSDRLRPVAGP